MNKKHLLSLCKNILNNCNPGEIITERRSFLIAIFEKHHAWELKRGVGIKSITVQVTKWGTRCFVINHVDDTQTDISYLQCINGKSSKLSDIKCACRHAVKDVIQSFRAANVTYGATRCPVTGEILLKNNTHIDHYNLSFEELFRLWIKNKSINELPLSESDVEIFFTDKKITEDFILFHNNNTHLRAISAKANLSILK